MATIQQLAVLAALGISGCSNASQTTNVAQTNAMLTSACPLYVRAVESSGSLSSYPFIRPEHVASIQRAKPLYKGEMAMWVTLTDVGAKRMYDQTAHSIGSQIVIFCGTKELNRPIIRGPVSKSFRVFVADSAGT